MSGRAARKVFERIFIAGDLKLETPAHFGNGDSTGLTDMPLLRDPLEGRPLLTGSSIAGALRAYLTAWEAGYGAERAPLADELFGQIQDRKSQQSWLMVDDALGERVPIEVRDGVAIDAATRTAADGLKYDTELLAAGATFPLSLELLVPEGRADLVTGLAVALRGFQQGEIGLGQRKRRGLGRCLVSGWTVRRYRFDTPAAVVDWLSGGGEARTGSDIVALLDTEALRVPDRRRRFTICATFTLPDSVLIRSAGDSAGAPDMVHLRSGDKPVISGTSLTGAIRARAARIARTVLGTEAGEALVDGMFGGRVTDGEEKLVGSRVLVQEHVIEAGRDLVQNRVKIDRFTGGAYPTALFSEQPVFGGDGTTVRLELELRTHASDLTRRDAEIGLLLLVLKDLWTGDLPIGGESGVGRGRLRGETATLVLHSPGEAAQSWTLERAVAEQAAAGDALADPRYRLKAAPQDLEPFVTAFNAWKLAEKSSGGQHGR